MKLGKAFADSVSIARQSSRRLRRSTIGAWWLGAGRALLFATILFLLFFILVWRLFDLTIIQGHRWRGLADGNRTRELIRHAPRGILLDRTQKPVVSNAPQYRLIKPCTGASSKDDGSCVTRLSQAEGEAIAASGLPSGTFLEIDYERRYLYPEALAHVVGYVGELTEKELEDDYYQLRQYRTGDRMGRMGAEAVFEEKLRGRDGKDLVEVDADGKILRTLGRSQEVAGEPITLSLDIGLAQAAADAFPKGMKGAVVVTKPSTGEVLAIYSSPSFSPNIFSLGMSQQEYDAFVTATDQPLFDRAIGGTYPPGSTFKPVTALAGLESGSITKDTTVEDIGVITIGPFTFPNWFFVKYGKTDGIVDIVKAIQRSNDIFFYKVGEWTGITTIAAWARNVGLGRPLGIELQGEASGVVPDPAWKALQFTSPRDLAARNNQWYLGDTYHVAIGQGYLLVTPMQVNTWTNVIANGGRLCRPTIQKISNVNPPAGGQISNCKDLGIKKETIALITDGMGKACAPGGTGWPLFNFRVKSVKSKVQSQEESISTTPVNSTLYTSDLFIPVACKTGTAEFGDPQERTHAWFTVFAPLPAFDSGLPARASTEVGDQDIKSDQDVLVGEPEISVTVLVEEGGEGSDVAAPIAKKILEAWFTR